MIQIFSFPLFLPSLPSAGEMQKHQPEEASRYPVRPSISSLGHQDQHAFYWFQKFFASKFAVERAGEGAD